ncbi:Glycosyl hydrolase family 57 [Maridesulfovibrio ferrireducens]|uniref:Glycosyl hydrolase family 57 n=1 Tax=Maridesulfovibrio ferrireducens TaxID=246191 RepID=A0A1G9B519_9BACT|nr:glycoside hydrolase [Maridesulfovibrio ferrireducens]SDK34677.1 Glycosyl hydrolase family 57 [Maridesulfovibrio ferrireducens]
MKLFAIFHLNLMFSSIPEESRMEVIERCYWPLLNLIEKHDFPLGIEASGITLEIIKDLAPEWIEKFKDLLKDNKTELIGSGYAQIIGPLVPASVNEANLRIGRNVCSDILETTPRIALVNEQAWSAGLVEHYINAGYEGVFMDYDNPARFSGWDEHIQHFPQRVSGIDGESIPVLWSRSMVFQKLQRFAHKELELSEYLEYVESLGTESGWLPVYGNDAEIFDFRPQRYKTEAVQEADSEWSLLLLAFKALQNRKHTFHLPSEVLNDLDHPQGGNKLSLCSAQQPVPVKKQSKYNITRWAVSGRNDFYINSLCRAVAAKLEQHSCSSPETEQKWRKLCFCWSSDFRTHITKERYAEAIQKLTNIAEKSSAIVEEPLFKVEGDTVAMRGRKLNVDTPSVSITLNTAKGLAIHKASFASHNRYPSFGTLGHGYFKDIDLGADFFSGHIIMEGPGIPKDTDLAKITPRIKKTSEFTTISCTMNLYQGSLDKAVRVYRDKQQIDVLYKFSLNGPPRGFMRLGHVTLLTGTMNPNKLFYATSSGGKRETHFLKDYSFDHSDHVSFLVSSSQAIGMTDSTVILGGEERALEISPLIKEHAFIGMIKCQQATPSPFVRVFFSMQEMDETSLQTSCEGSNYIFSTGFSIKPYMEDKF